MSGVPRGLDDSVNFSFSQLAENVDAGNILSSGEELTASEFLQVTACLICPLCQNWLGKQVMVVQTCGHWFCSRCINDAIEKGFEGDSKLLELQRRALEVVVPSRFRMEGKKLCPKFSCPICLAPAHKWTLTELPLVSILSNYLKDAGLLRREDVATMFLEEGQAPQSLSEINDCVAERRKSISNPFALEEQRVECGTFNVCQASIDLFARPEEDEVSTSGYPAIDVPSIPVRSPLHNKEDDECIGGLSIDGDVVRVSPPHSSQQSDSNSCSCSEGRVRSPPLHSLHDEKCLGISEEECGDEGQRTGMKELLGSVPTLEHAVEKFGKRKRCDSEESSALQRKVRTQTNDQKRPFSSSSYNAAGVERVLVDYSLVEEDLPREVRDCFFSTSPDGDARCCTRLGFQVVDEREWNEDHNKTTESIWCSIPESEDETNALCFSVVHQTWSQEELKTTLVIGTFDRIEYDECIMDSEREDNTNQMSNSILPTSRSSVLTRKRVSFCVPFLTPIVCTALVQSSWCLDASWWSEFIRNASLSNECTTRSEYSPVAWRKNKDTVFYGDEHNAFRALHCTLSRGGIPHNTETSPLPPGRWISQSRYAFCMVPDCWVHQALNMLSYVLQNQGLETSTYSDRLSATQCFQFLEEWEKHRPFVASALTINGFSNRSWYRLLLSAGGAVVELPRNVWKVLLVDSVLKIALSQENTSEFNLRHHCLSDVKVVLLKLQEMMRLHLMENPSCGSNRNSNREFRAVIRLHSNANEFSVGGSTLPYEHLLLLHTPLTERFLSSCEVETGYGLQSVRRLFSLLMANMVQSLFFVLADRKIFSEVHLTAADNVLNDALFDVRTTTWLLTNLAEGRHAPGVKCVKEARDSVPKQNPVTRISLQTPDVSGSSAPPTLLANSLGVVASDVEPNSSCRFRQTLVKDVEEEAFPQSTSSVEKQLQSCSEFVEPVHTGKDDDGNTPLTHPASESMDSSLRPVLRNFLYTDSP